MPRKAKRICRGCGRLTAAVARGRCASCAAAHVAAENARRNAKPRRRVYDSSRWKGKGGTRARVLRRDGRTCVDCGRHEEELEPNEKLLVDHERGLSVILAGGGDPFDDDECAARCSTCSGRKDGARAAGVGMSVGVDALHPRANAREFRPSAPKFRGRKTPGTTGFFAAAENASAFRAEEATRQRCIPSRVYIVAKTKIAEVALTRDDGELVDSIDEAKDIVALAEAGNGWAAGHAIIDGALTDRPAIVRAAAIAGLAARS